MKRILALVLSIMLAVCALSAFAEGGVSYVTASTPVYTASDSQLINIEKASDALSGWYVPAGGYFSFNDAVGPRTYEAGYVDAVNGRGAESQASATLR